MQSVSSYGLLNEKKKKHFGNPSSPKNREDAQFFGPLPTDEPTPGKNIERETSMIPEHRLGRKHSVKPELENLDGVAQPPDKQEVAPLEPDVEERDLDEEQELEDYEMLSQLFDYDALREE